MLYPLSKRGVISHVRRGAQPRVNEVESDDVGHTDTVSVCYESNRLNNDENAEQDVEVGVPPHYTRYAAEREGTSDRTIRRRLRIAEKLYPEVRDYIRGTPLADDQRGLLRLTRLEDPELQLAAARLIVEEGVPPRLAVERAQRVAAQAGTPALEGLGRQGQLRESKLSRTWGRNVFDPEPEGKTPGANPGGIKEEDRGLTPHGRGFALCPGWAGGGRRRRWPLPGPGGWPGGAAPGPSSAPGRPPRGAG